MKKHLIKSQFLKNLTESKTAFQAKLASTFAPSVIKLSKIFDIDERKYREMGLHFRHTDNINYFLTAAKVVGLPQVRICHWQWEASLEQIIQSITFLLYDIYNCTVEMSIYK